jgi:hypothetical protein
VGGSADSVAGSCCARETTGSGRMHPEMSYPPVGNLFGRDSLQRSREYTLPGGCSVTWPSGSASFSGSSGPRGCAGRFPCFGVPGGAPGIATTIVPLESTQHRWSHLVASPAVVAFNYHRRNPSAWFGGKVDTKCPDGTGETSGLLMASTHTGVTFPKVDTKFPDGTGETSGLLMASTHTGVAFPCKDAW